MSENNSGDNVGRLVLSRNKNESVVIRFGGQSVVITIVDLKPDRVRIGFQADRSVHIDRGEIYASKMKNGEI